LNFYFFNFLGYIPTSLILKLLNIFHGMKHLPNIGIYLLYNYNSVSVCLSVRPTVDLGFKTSTDGQDQVLKSRSLDGRGGWQGRGRQGRAGRPGKKTWEILGYGFQDLGSQLWGLGNFRIWFSGLGISTLGPGKF
jgi:hypothetical protein